MPYAVLFLVKLTRAKLLYFKDFFSFRYNKKLATPNYCEVANIALKLLHSCQNQISDFNNLKMKIYPKTPYFKRFRQRDPN